MTQSRQTSRSLPFIVLAWLAVVMAGSALVWTVISRAGSEVGDPTEDARVSAPGPTTQSARPSAHPTKTPAPTSTRSTTPSVSPSATPHQTTSSEPTHSAEPSEEPHTTPSATQEAAVRRTWQGTGGILVVECTGSTIRLVGTQPDSGFHVEVDERGPDRVRVQFESLAEGGPDTDVRSECRGGTPVFSEQDDN